LSSRHHFFIVITVLIRAVFPNPAVQENHMASQIFGKSIFWRCRDAKRRFVVVRRLIDLTRFW
jgi:hypothetical protein